MSRGAPVLAFVAAFLSFSLELWFAKSLLPRLGGSAAVWTCASTAFQVLLVAAYLAAPKLARRPRLAAALLVLPLPILLLGVPASTGLSPAPELLRAFALGVALPFFTLSTTVVVLETSGLDGGTLYAASNAGAFTALAAYPFLIEPLLGLGGQRALWVALYAGCATLAVFVLRGRSAGPSEPPLAPADPAALILLAAAPAAASLATTNLLSMDFAAVPLLWTLPLAVYLATFVLCFKKEPWSPRRLDAALLAFFALALGVIVFSLRHTGGLARALDAGKSVYLLFAEFTVCLVLHRSLAAARPPARAGRYFAWVAAGGAVGGAVVAVGVPLLGRLTASTTLDWAAAGALTAAALAWRDRVALRAKPAKAIAFGVTAAAACAALLLASARPGTLESRRTFYGIYSVRAQGGMLVLYHGNTEHGAQRAAESPARPLPYYCRSGPLGDAWDALGSGWARVGVVGLGAGALAAYGRPGGTVDFYELDPGVTELTRRRFAYLRESRAVVRVIDGDGRLSLARSTSIYDVLALDAFSSGSVPVHLLTKEALKTYLERLAPGGTILVHLSNRWLDLRPEVGASARDLGLVAIARRDEKTSEPGCFPSTWAVLARDAKTLSPLAARPGWAPLGAGTARAWTDRRASLLPFVSL